MGLIKRLLTWIASFHVFVGFVFLVLTLFPSAHWVCQKGHLIRRCVKPADIWSLDKYFKDEVALSIQIFVGLAVLSSFSSLILSQNKRAPFVAAVTAINVLTFLFSAVPWILILAYAKHNHVNGFAVYLSILASFAFLIAAVIDLYATFATFKAEVEDGDLDVELLSKPKPVAKSKLLIAITHLSALGATFSLVAVSHLFSLSREKEKDGLEAKGLEIAVFLLSVDSAALLAMLKRDTARKLSPKVVECVVFAFSTVAWILSIASVVFVNREEEEFGAATVASLISLLVGVVVSIGSAYLAFAS